nr:hydroxyacylglutathione hydrolase C-terminal domain-containing protein [Burkholderia multivorans]
MRSARACRPAAPRARRATRASARACLRTGGRSRTRTACRRRTRAALACADRRAGSTRYGRACDRARPARRTSRPARRAHERAVNPFLRADDAAIHATLEAELHESVPDRLTAFTLMREWKNRFR